MHDRLKELFERALALPVEARLDFLAQECGENRALLNEVMSLLQADDAYSLPFNANDFHQADHQSLIKELLSMIDVMQTSRTFLSNPDFRIGDLIGGRYEILSEEPIGKGGTGHVYLAKDTKYEFNNEVALKHLRHRIYRAEHLYLAEQFQREAEILRNLRHPGIPGKIDIVKEGVETFLVMEYIYGDDLEQQLEKRGGKPFPYQQVLKWADELLRILDYIHTINPQKTRTSSGPSKAIIHRDIKPSNLKIRSDKLMLIDFGFAKSGWLDLTNSDPKFNPYTLHYASLEQLNGEPPSIYFDIYSVGATLYTLLSGNIPDHARQRSDQVLKGHRDPLKPLSELNLNIPPALSKLVAQAMSLKPTARPPNAAAMLEALLEIQTPVHRSRILAGVALCLVLLVPAGIFFSDRIAPIWARINTSAQSFFVGAGSEETGSSLPKESNAAIPIDSTFQTNQTPVETNPVPSSPIPSNISSATVTSNFYLDSSEGERLNGRGIINIDDASLDASMWNAYTLDVGEHVLSASFRGNHAKRVTLTYELDGQKKSETINIGSSGIVSVTIKPEMKNLRILFHI